MGIRSVLRYFAKSYTKFMSYLPKKRIITLFSSTPLIGNARALYMYAINNKLEEKYNFNLIWITNSTSFKYINRLGYPSCDIRKIYCLNIYSRAIIHVADNFLLRPDRLFKGKNTKVVLTWHGIGPKIYRQRPWDTILEYNSVNKFVDYAISTSDFSSLLLSEFLRLDISKFIVTGYPRQDKIIQSSYDASRKIIKNITSRNNFDKIILYAPTYRYSFLPGYRLHEIHGNPISEFMYVKGDILRNICNLLREHNSILIVRYHPQDEAYFKYNAGHMLRSPCKNIFVINSDMMAHYNVDMFDILPGVDVLITDYSSILHDYILLNRPIIFYVFDLEKYYSNAGLIIEPKSYRDILPGPVVNNGRELVDALKSVLKGDDDYSLERNKIKNILHRFADGRSSERVWKLILTLLEESSI